jgi:ceramide glucosyltransferase
VRTITLAGDAGAVLTHAVAIATVGALATGFGLTASVFLVISVLLRWVTAGVIARALGFAFKRLWLLPARDALSFAVFVASFFGRKVFWRDQLFQVEPSGRMSVDGD